MQYLICQEKEKFPAIYPNFYFYFFKKNAIRKRHHITCKALSNLCKLDVANTENQSFNLLFLSSPNSTCNIPSREIEGKTKLVPRLHSKHKI
jgi:hypothetical protein